MEGQCRPPLVNYIKVVVREYDVPSLTSDHAINVRLLRKSANAIRLHDIYILIKVSTSCHQQYTASMDEHHKHSQPAVGGPPPNTSAETRRNPIPTIRFYQYLRINWKFSMANEYALVQKPASNDDAAIYRFASAPNAPSQPVRNALFGITQGFSKNFYKQYSVTISFQGMSHKEVLEFCSKHETSREMICILETY